MNRLKVNMENKIGIINGAIGQLRRMKNGETIEVNGLHKIKISRGKLTNQQINDRISDLMVESLGLQERCERFKNRGK